MTFAGERAMDSHVPTSTFPILSSHSTLILHQSVYQPPGAVHCPDCNVCIKGFDHHCPWMGTCIGEKNYTPFLAFNITWLIYLFYAIVWVLNVGAQLYYRAHHPSSPVTPNDDDDET